MSAKDMFYGKDKAFSESEERLMAREDLIFNVTEDLLVLMEDREVTKQELARRLSKSKSFVTQVLSGSRNMTLGTLSDICFELGVKPKIELPVEKAKSDAVPVVVAVEMRRAKAAAATKPVVGFAGVRAAGGIAFISLDGQKPTTKTIDQTISWNTNGQTHLERVVQ